MTDAVLLVGDSETDANLFYKTGFLAEGLVYLEVDGHGTILTNSMEKGRAEKQAKVDTIRTWDEFNFREIVKETNDRRRAFATVLAKAVQEVGATRVVVGPSFPALLADNLRNAGVQLEIDPELFV